MHNRTHAFVAWLPRQLRTPEGFDVRNHERLPPLQLRTCIPRLFSPLPADSTAPCQFDDLFPDLRCQAMPKGDKLLKRLTVPTHFLRVLRRFDASASGT